VWRKEGGRRISPSQHNGGIRLQRRAQLHLEIWSGGGSAGLTIGTVFTMIRPRRKEERGGEAPALALYLQPRWLFAMPPHALPGRANL